MTTTPTSTPLLQVKSLRAGYGKAEVLHGIDLQAAPGSVITVIGPNGAGKSTLLNALMGILPAQGQVFFKGQDISRLTLEERVMQGMALVPEKRELFGTMSVEDNLVLGAFRQVRLKNPAWRDELEAVYQRFPRLRERRSQLAGTLSGGERQMLAVGRALMSQPTLLMLDEPSLGLAPLMVDEVLDTVRTLKNEGMTILLVEQNVHEALSLADRGYLLQSGRLVGQGSGRELLDDPMVRSAYLGL